MIKGIIDIPSPVRGISFTILFTIICVCVYEWGLFHKEKLRRYLENKIETLTEEKRVEKLAFLDLMEEIEAEKDPEWLEMVLKKNLGVVGIGETKIVIRIIE